MTNGYWPREDRKIAVDIVVIGQNHSLCSVICPFFVSSARSLEKMGHCELFGKFDEFVEYNSSQYPVRKRECVGKEL